MKDNLLSVSWHDSNWIPLLNPSNILDYFSERTNPFYDRTCNNEIVRMQRLSPEQLNNMTGLEYILLHVQEPILYVVRKQHRHTPTQATPLADYYIIAGVVYQAPDLGSVVNSRLMNTVNHLQSAFDECLSYNRYHPSKGYSWEFKDKDPAEEKSKKKEAKKSQEPSSVFQRQRVDVLLNELTQRFPPLMPQGPMDQQESGGPGGLDPSGNPQNPNQSGENESSSAGGEGHPPPGKGAGGQQQQPMMEDSIGMIKVENGLEGGSSSSKGPGSVEPSGGGGPRREDGGERGLGGPPSRVQGGPAKSKK